MVSNLQQSLSGLYEIAKKLNTKIQINNNDYTAFQVFASNVAYNNQKTYRDVAELSGYVPSAYLDEKLAVAIPSGMTEKFRLRTSCPPEKSDVIIDWGDKTATYMNDPNVQDVTFDWDDEDKEWRYVTQHTYTQPGKYIIKIYGNGYYNIDHKYGKNYNLVCRIFDGDLPVASHLHNFARTCYDDPRLFYVQLNGYDAWCQHADNLSELFAYCTNLLECNGFRKRASMQTDNEVFRGCWNLRKTDYQLKSIYSRQDDPPIAQFCDCKTLAVDINNLLPDIGFVGIMNMTNIFNKCENLTCNDPSKLASKLWEDLSVNFTNTGNAFTGCTNLSGIVPISWGGANDTIEFLPNKIQDLLNEVTA